MTYKTKTGMNYPDAQGQNKRAEAGDLVSDLPVDAIGWLLEQGWIEEIAPVVAPSYPPLGAAVVVEHNIPVQITEAVPVVTEPEKE